MALYYGGVTYDGGVNDSGSGTSGTTQTSSGGSTSAPSSNSTSKGFDWGSLFGSLGGILNGGANVVGAIKGAPTQYGANGQPIYPVYTQPDSSRSIVLYLGGGVVVLGLVYFLFLRSK